MMVVHKELFGKEITIIGVYASTIEVLGEN